MKLKSHKCQLCKTAYGVSGFAVDEASEVQSITPDFISPSHLILCGSCLDGLAILNDEYEKLHNIVDNVKDSLKDLLGLE